MTYKIVDTFNGYESQSWAKQESAETQLTENLKEFYAHPGNTNSRFCQVIMPGHVAWQWDEKQNTFLWK